MNKLIVSATAVTVLALGVLAGASVASAGTVICYQNETPCANSNIQPAGAGIGGIAQDNEYGLTLSAFLKYQCKGGAYAAKTTGVVGNPLSAIGSVNNNVAYCSVTNGTGYTCTELKVSEPPATIAATKNGEGTVTYGTAGEHLSVKVSCSRPDTGTWTCKWGSASVAFNLAGGEYGTKEASLSLEEKSGSAPSLCVSTAKLTISTQSVGYISGGTYTVICDQNETPCANSNIQPAGTGIGGIAQDNQYGLTLSAFLNYQCKGGAYAAKTTGVVGNPLSAVGSVNNNVAYCSVTNGTEYTCTELKVSEPPATIAATKNGEGTVTYGTAGEHLSVKVSCSRPDTGTWTCKWGSASVAFNLAGGEYGTKEASLSLEEKSGSAPSLCVSTAKLTISTQSVGYISGV